MTTRFHASDLINEMARDRVRPASSNEAGWYWLSLDGRRYWVTKL